MPNYFFIRCTAWGYTCTHSVHIQGLTQLIVFLCSMRRIPGSVCVCLPLALEQSTFMPHIYSSLFQSLSPSYSLSYHCRMWPFCPPSESHSKPSHYSLALVASTSSKIKLTHSASLLCHCNYKSGLSPSGRREKRGGGEVHRRGLWVEGEPHLTRRVAARPPLGIKLAQATGESIRRQSAQQCTHPAAYVNGNGKHCCYAVWALRGSACERPAPHRLTHITHNENKNQALLLQSPPASTT